MCGITGIYTFNLIGKFHRIHVTQATQALSSRGPDFQDIYLDEVVGLGHRRLSIIDTSAAGNQPMWDSSHRYGLVFNGEIFNYLELRTELQAQGVSFQSESDSEVLLQLLILLGEAALPKLNGFFAFCFYDNQRGTMLLARDRYGIKPLLYCFDEDKFIFASEMKSILQYGVDKSIDKASLQLYFQLNYIPAPHTIFNSVKKVMPGTLLKIKNQQLESKVWYNLPAPNQQATTNTSSYQEASDKFLDLLDDAVKRRLISDVPIGCFLSGGLDSSVIAALASKHVTKLHTFSIGFKDEKFFDETAYAQLVATKLQTEHTVFSLGNDDLYQHLNDILAYIDEPFADSSAIAVYILSKETRKRVVVALSGDGADELLGGYNKHSALLRTLQPGIKESLVSSLAPLWRMLPKSRNNPIGNKIRQLDRYARGSKQTLEDRYWTWATFLDPKQTTNLLATPYLEPTDIQMGKNRRQDLLSGMNEVDQMNGLLRKDVELVLPNDMLMKVDLMSMANHLEVRVPFLDYRVVEFLMQLPSDYKINSSGRKRILKDTFRNMLPDELYNRPKKGFEVPLLGWLRKELRPRIELDLLEDEYILKQGIFNPEEIKRLKKKLFSSDPGDIHATIWALIVFQTWYKRVMQ